ncbi:MAG: hypothetical protein ACF8MJ_01145 [Phycisphaerales bacterium JB050]
MLFRNRRGSGRLVARTLGLSLMCGVAGLLGLAAAPAAQAVGEPGPIQMTVQHCVQQISAVAEHARERIENRSQFVVQRINQLDANDASVAVMVTAAQEGREAVAETSGAATQRINHLTMRCVHALNHLGAPDQAVSLLQQARQRALQSIELKQRQGIRAINEALRAALEDEDLPGGE